MNLILLCDFDGTIVDVDTCVFLFEKFVNEDWKSIDSQYVKGEITLEECMQTQLSMLKASKLRMLRELEKVTSFRRGFKTSIEYCEKQGIPFIIVSAGLDFVIEHFIKQIGCDNFIRTYSPKTIVTEVGIELSFPTLLDGTSVNFKEDLVKHYKKLGYRVIYLGDGVSDYYAVRTADFKFVIEGSRLAEICKRGGIPYQEINDFQDIIDFLNTLL